MQDIEPFKQVYDHIIDKVKSFSVSILLLASLLTNWDLLYFLMSSQYSARETISIAVDVYFSPWHLLWVYLVLSAAAPIVIFSSKTLYNKVHIPLERAFNKHIRGITYPNQEEYEKIVTKYEALEQSFKSGELYDELKAKNEKLSEEIRSLKGDKEALLETIDNIKSENMSEVDRDASKDQQFVHKFFFSDETQKLASHMLNTLENKIRGDRFTATQITSLLPTKHKVDKVKVIEILNDWTKDKLLDSRTPFGAPETDYKLTTKGISILTGGN